MTAFLMRAEGQPNVAIAHRFRTHAMAWCGLLAVALVLMTTATTTLLAQTPALPLPGANRLVGVVTDTLGNPLPEVSVVITKPRRQTRTRADGSFRFDSVPAGTYELSAHSIGLIAGVFRADVGPAGASVVLPMIRIGTVLQARVTVAERIGLSGVIGDTAYQALPEVTVTVMGTGEHAKTDSSGAFFMPLKPGEYMLRLDRDGFTRQLVSVSVPNEAGRRIAAWMSPQSGRSNVMEAVRVFDLNQRLMRVSPASSKYFTREGLEKQGVADLLALARRNATSPITDDCKVSINGSDVTIPLGALTTDELEFVEMYLPTYIGTVRGGTSIEGNPTKFTLPAAYKQPSAQRACGNLTLIAWLRN